MSKMTSDTTLVCTSCGASKTYPKGMEVIKVKMFAKAFADNGSICRTCVSNGVTKKVATPKGERTFRNVRCTEAKCFATSGDERMTRSEAKAYKCDTHKVQKPVAKKARATKKAAAKKEVSN